MIATIILPFFCVAIALVMMKSDRAEARGTNEKVERNEIIKQPVISFCSGHNFGCAVLDDKRMRCWGERYKPYDEVADYDMIGDEGSRPIHDDIDASIVDVGKHVGIDKVSCGAYHLCVKLDNGELKCLGDNLYGQTGTGISASPIGEQDGYVGDNLPVIDVGTQTKVIDITLGYAHSCAIVTGHKVKCFGWNIFAQLGEGLADVKGLSPFDMGDDLNFTNLGNNIEISSVYSSPSAYHSCATILKPASDAQRFKCWGLNHYNQLGYGVTKQSKEENISDDIGKYESEMGDNLPMVDLGIESRVKQLALGSSHTCALLVSDVLKCFGSAFYGQLGSGSTEEMILIGNSLPSVLTDSGKTVKLVTAGAWHTCIVYDDMITMKCMGGNWVGQLGQGDTVDRGYTPKSMIPSIPAIQLGTGSLKIKSIVAGYYHNCVIFEDSSVKCFGDNVYSQLDANANKKAITIIGGISREMGIHLDYVRHLNPDSDEEYQE